MINKWLALPHPYPQVAEALCYNCDQSAAFLLEATLLDALHGVLRIVEDNASFLSHEQIPYVKALLRAQAAKLEAASVEERKMLIDLASIEPPF